MVGTVAGVAIAARFGLGVELAAYLLLVVAAILLSTIDLATYTMPDRIMAPAACAAVFLLAVAAFSADSAVPWWRAVAAGAASFVGYLILALVTGQLGLGDCKAAAVCGAFLGFQSWRQVALGPVAAFVLAGIVAATRAAWRSGRSRHHRLAFGPYLFGGAVLVIVLAGH
ncbi:leader peptidase (prepilin peptidase)/N-methyltransferase [Catenulispora sp. GAS73]|uniref:prepilin peptidase n=1 Tax=Catenulispora sp. GAS73 TaxID=3156269 RepID=UPI003513E9F6